MEKPELRDHMKQKLAKLTSVQERSKKAVLQIQKDHLTENTKSLCVYIALDTEVDLKELVEYAWQNDLEVYVPDLDFFLSDGKFRFVKWKKEDRLEVGPMRIHMPVSAETVLSPQIDLMFVPGLAFTEEGKRLGRGLGFYDRLLFEKPTKTVGVCFREQIVEDIPTNDFDQSVQQLVVC